MTEIFLASTTIKGLVLTGQPDNASAHTGGLYFLPFRLSNLSIRPSRGPIGDGKINPRVPVDKFTYPSTGQDPLPTDV